MSYEDLLLEKRDGIATVTLNAPDKLNALTLGLRRSLLRIGVELANDDDVRVIIITGAGASHGSEAFFKMDKPVIAAVNGACVGAGFSLALSMDIRIASVDARFSAVFVRRGLVPDCGISYWLPQAVGMSKAMELMFTGEIIDAAEAERIGIVSKVVPADELLPAANELAARIVAQPPISVELSKRMAYRGVADRVAQQIELETGGQIICSGSEDNREAVRAFFEKRPPNRFVGR